MKESNHLDGSVKAREVFRKVKQFAIIHRHGVDCDDLVQESLLKLCKQQRGVWSWPNSYLFQVVRTTALDIRRRQLRHITHHDDSVNLPDNGSFDDDNNLENIAAEGYTPLELLQKGELYAAVREQVAYLSPTHREAIWLSASGFSYSQIAEVTGAPLNTVRSRLHYARKTLAPLLQAQI